MKNVENKIMEIMKRKNMSMGDLSRITEIPKTTISRYLNHAGTIPADRLPLIANALNTTPEILMGWESEESQNKYGTIIKT